MLRNTCLLVFVLSLVLVGPRGLHAEYRCGGDAKASNAEYQLTTQDMVVVAPDPGKPKVGPVKIDFCDRVVRIENPCPPLESKAASSFKRSFEGAGNYGFDPKTIEWMLGQVCQFPDDPGFQEAMGYMVQQWVNWYGQSKEEALESIVLRGNAEEWKKQKEAGCSKFTYSKEASPQEKWSAKARAASVGCGHGETIDMHWHVDQSEQPPSELERLFFAQACLASPTKLDLEDENDWLRIGLCGADIRALDKAKVDKETAGMPAPLQAMARENAAEVKATFGDLERAAKPTVDADPDYKRLLYDAPQAGWSDWVKAYQKHKKAMDATFQFEKALFGPSTKALGQCWGVVEKGVIDFVKAGKFKTMDQFIEGMTGPIGYVLINALGACYAVSSPADIGALLLEITKGYREWRGPRVAAQYAMVDALNEIKKDRDRFPIRYNALGSRHDNLVLQWAQRGGPRSKIGASGGSYYEKSTGVVKTAKSPKDDKQWWVVTFKTETWMEDTRECWNTNRVRSVNTHGDVLYYRKCKSTGKQKKSSTPPKMGFYTWSAKGIKPNAFVKFRVSPESQRISGAYPIEVYTNKKQTKLVNAYGFEL